MDVSPNALRKEVVQTLIEINRRLEHLEHGPERATLLAAKIQCIQTLVMLGK